MAYVSTLLVSNIHCPSCVSYVEDVLREIPAIHSVQVSLINHTIRVVHAYDGTRELIVKELIRAAFDVQHATTFDSSGEQTHDQDVAPEGISAGRASALRWRLSRAQGKHIANCKACQQENRGRTPTATIWSALTNPHRPPRPMDDASHKPSSMADGATTPDTAVAIDIDGANETRPASHHVAHISVGGMTCASCRSTITKELEELDFVESVDVNLMANTARVVYISPIENSNKIVEAIEDLGYEATLDQAPQSAPEALPKDNAQSKFKTSLSIEGMTCGTCVGTITRGLRELPYVQSVNIDLVGNRGVVMFRGTGNLEGVLEKIDDLGYDATVVSIEEVSNQARVKKQDRTIQLKVDGMYCGHCPRNIQNAIQAAIQVTGTDEGPDYRVTQLPTLDDPVMTIVYRPSPQLTVRSFITAIDTSHEALKAHVYHPPTLEERSRRLQRKEQRHILWRLLFTGAVAIPSFIIGVVYMSLVPKSNSTRQWWEEPILGGNAMRLEWALFFMTTPVMAFGADLFHTRAWKEIKAMWRRNSKVPILRRFYRFGSMNLLISAGTAVAYFSSLAVLIMDATTRAVPISMRRTSDTYFDTVTFLTFFILIGRFLEAYSKTKTGDAVALLSNLRPSEAFLVEAAMSSTKENGGGSPTIYTRTIPVDQLEVGDVVQIPHGASPPADGTIDQEGTFLFDESSLTGESKPVKKTFGDEVYAGSVNASDPVRISVTEIGGTSMLDRIVNVVREGQAKRAPIERIADIMTGYFVPVITLIAILTWLIWLSLGISGSLPSAWLDVSRGGWPFWSLEFAIAVFVVACPCGIGLAAPTALFVGGGLAAKHGILVQGGGEAFQEASRLDKIVFDKTGTLTEGHMRVTDFDAIQTTGHVLDQLVNEDFILALSRAMEESSTHPIAKAITEYCGQRTTEALVEPMEIKEVPGQGMRAKFSVRVSGKTAQYEIALGNERLLQSLCGPVRTSEHSGTSRSSANKADVVTVQQEDVYLGPILQKHRSLGRTTAIFAARPIQDDSDEELPFHPVAVFAVADPVRAEAPEILQSLRDANLDIHMCTGDNRTTALAIASQLAIPVSNVRAEVLPQDKAAYIRELQGLAATDQKGKRALVAFVGDGTNDTPALSAADVSIALSSGSDVAMTAASFILLNPNLNTILALIRLARRVFLRVKLNFAWAAVYNICLVPVAAGVFFAVGANHHHAGWRMSPVWASVAMAASSVSVVMSSLALKLPELRWRR